MAEPTKTDKLKPIEKIPTMDKVEYRTVIKFMTKEGKKAKEIHDRLVSAYKASAPSYATVTRWHKEFRKGRESLKDDIRVGRPPKATSDDSVDRVKAIIAENRRVKVKEISQALKISHGSVCTIIQQFLDMHKVAGRWVARSRAKNKEPSQPPFPTTDHTAQVTT